MSTVADILIQVRANFSDVQDQLDELMNALRNTSSRSEEGKAKIEALGNAIDELLTPVTALKAGNEELAESADKFINSLNKGIDDKFGADALNEAAAAATTAADAQVGMGAASTDLNAQLLSQQAELAGLVGDIDELRQQLLDAGAEVSQLKEHLEEMKHTEEEDEETTKELIKTLAEVSGIVVGWELLKETVKESIGAFANVEKAEIAIKGLTGSTEQAREMIEKLKQLALDRALEFEPLVGAAQRMIAFGLTTEQAVATMRAASGAAIEAHTSVEAAANSMTRMATNGTVNDRVLRSLALTTKGLAETMGVTTGEVSKAFKAMDQSERIEVLIKATQKFQAAADEVAKGIAGQWQILQDQWDFILEDMGKQLAPVATETTKYLQDLVRDTKPAIESLVNLSKAFKDLGEAVGLSHGAMIDIVAFIVTRNPYVAFAISVLQVGAAMLSVVQAQRALEGANDSLAGSVAVLEMALLRNKVDFRDLQQQYGMGYITSEQYRLRLLELAKAHSLSGKAAEDAEKAEGRLSAGAKSIIEQQQKLDEAYQSAKKSYEDLQNAAEQYNKTGQGTKITADELTRAHNAMTAAFKAANPAIEANAKAHEAAAKAAEAYAKAHQQMMEAIRNVDAWLIKSIGAISDQQKAWNAASGDMEKYRGTLDALDKEMGKFVNDNPLPAFLIDTTEDLRTMDSVIKDLDASMKKLMTNNPLPKFLTDTSLAATEVDKAMVKAGMESQTALNQAAGAAREAYQNMLQLQQQGIATDAQVKAVKDRMTELQKEADHVTKAMKGSWEALGKQIENTFAKDVSGAISGVIFKTQTLSQAFKKLGEDITKEILDTLIAKGIKALIGAVGQWMGVDAAASAAHQASTEKNQALDAEASLESQILSVTKGVGEVMADAAVAAAGAYAAIAAIPIVGPALAPEAALTAYAGTASYASLVAAGFAEKGAVVPEDMMTMLHKNEMVLPAHLSEGMQNIINNYQGETTTGGTAIINIHSNNPPAVMQELTRYLKLYGIVPKNQQR